VYAVLLLSPDHESARPFVVEAMLEMTSGVWACATASRPQHNTAVNSGAKTAWQMRPFALP
jgi:hypothetical protein